MTTAEPPAVAASEVAASSRLRRLVAREWPLALEVVALTVFVVARPLLASLGRSPETFIARGADWTDVIAFGVLLILLPAAVLVAIAAVANAGGPRLRAAVHLVVVGALTAVAAWQLGARVTRMELLPVAGPACAAAGVVAAVLRHRAEWPGRFLRFASVGALVFLAQFLFASPTSAIVFGGRHGGPGPAVTAAVAEAAGDDAPPVVVLIFDGMPTGLLLDGEGRIDGELYPNLADLAARSTWYRNHTTVAPMTLRAVPAILAGRAHEQTVAPVTSRYPLNLFTLLGGVYDVHADEPITGLCPVSLCPGPGGTSLNELAADAWELWELQITGESQHFIPGVFDDRQGRLDAWLAAQDFGRGERPDLFVVHATLPHDPWWYLPDGTTYDPLPALPGMLADHWGDTGADVGRQRHVLQMQATDTFVGAIVERMRAAGTFDDALFVVTADHGYGFEPGSRMRGIAEGNIDQVLWTPLIVKSPGQDEGVVDDRNVLSVDVLPTIADELGIDLDSDDLDGVPASAARRDPADKAAADWALNDLRADDRGQVHVDGEAGFARMLESEAVRGDGPLAIWDRTGEAHGELVGRRVDDLTRGAPRPEVVTVNRLGRWRNVDTEVPPLELLGIGPVAPGTAVAVAAEGTVAAVVPAEATPFGIAAVHAMLWPDALVAGHNEITMYVVEGSRREPVLHELTVEAGTGG
ncbi:MAG TPA: sulfatase-like hydrolase/transferase [Acidimicrobiales bacterium]